MKRADVNRLAIESGLYSGAISVSALERFAELVAAAEREACAALVMGMHSAGWDGFTIAAKIRARGQE